MPTCWVQALRQPHTTTATLAQLLVTTPSSYGRGRRRGGCVVSRDVAAITAVGWSRLLLTHSLLSLCTTESRKVQGIAVRVGQSSNIIVVQSVASGLPKNCTFYSNVTRVLTLWTQALRPHMSSACFLQSTTHVSLYNIPRMVFLSNGSTLRSLWATKWIFVCTEYFPHAWLFGGQSPRRTGFKPSRVHVGFVVRNFALSHFLRVLRFTPITVIPPVLTITLHSFVKQAGKAWEPVSGNIYLFIYF